MAGASPVARGRGPDGRGRRLLQARKGRPEKAGIAGVDGILRQNVRFAAETADALDAPHERGQDFGSNALEFVACRSLLEESIEFLVQGGLYGRQFHAGLRRGLQKVQRADLT